VVVARLGAFETALEKVWYAEGAALEAAEPGVPTYELSGERERGPGLTAVRRARGDEMDGPDELDTFELDRARRVSGDGDGVDPPGKGTFEAELIPVLCLALRLTSTQ
jgi:hypothetical protein